MLHVFITKKKWERERMNALLRSINTHANIFREKPWSFWSKVNTNFPDILHLDLSDQLTIP